VCYYWESGTPLTSEQLLVLVEQHVISSKNQDAINLFVEGKRNTMHKFVSHVLKRNQWSVRKISILQVQERFCSNNVDVVVKADETVLPFHPSGEKLLAPVGVKHVGMVAQVDNEKFSATVMIACEYWTSSILPSMVKILYKFNQSQQYLF
jgi:hypothetical protein